MSNTNAITFWNFLKRNEIEIPIIQRDYAQGRLGKENLRKNFLTDLKNALDSDKTMKLDFIYGSIENNKLNPLDGQQRLTTLWLLHWYIALRAGKLNGDTCEIFKNFTYETRISSREFCENLCNPRYFANFIVNDIVGFITKQTWFYSAWKQDPTIQSMLRMLGGTKIADKKGEDIVDGIEEIFHGKGENDFKLYWEKLTQKEVFVFYHLPLKDFGLSDDLYIKMNARGKQLTSFENFKADLIGYITKQSENDSAEKSAQTEWDKLLDPKSGIPIKLDTDWTNLFWENRSEGIKDKDEKMIKLNHIDETFFAFVNRFFWNELFIAKKIDNPEEYILDIGQGDESSTQENNNSSYKYLNNSDHIKDYDTTIVYMGLDVYKYDNGIIPLSFFKKLERVLGNYSAYSKVLKDINCLPECSWDTSFRFIPEYVKENGNNIEIENNAQEKILKVSTLNQIQRIVFFAVCKYFDHDNNISDNELSLKQWMRVVWNLVSGEDQNGRPDIRSTSAMRSAIEFIDSLDSHDVYQSLINKDINTNSAFGKRCKEEQEKAKKILVDDKWEKKIIVAEQHAFFKGSIRFLYANEVGEVDWDDYDTKWNNAQNYFDKNGISAKYAKDCNLLRRFISHFDNWDCFLHKKYDNALTTWLSILSKSWERNPEVCAIHNLLINNDALLFVFSTFTSQLPMLNKKQKQVQEELVRTTLLCDVVNGCYLNWRDPNYLLYPYNVKSEQKKYLLSSVRNQILSSLISQGKISSSQKLKSTPFFWGWNVSFVYKQSQFVWTWNNKLELTNNQTVAKCVPLPNDILDSADERGFINLLDKML